MVEKDNAIDDYCVNVIKKSWTWERLTDKEKSEFIDRINTYQRERFIQGTTKQRRQITMLLYDTYLYGLGYGSEPISWRSKS